MAVQTIEKSLHNRAYKLSSIANPTNGSGFFHVLYNLDWSAKGLVVTEDKLQTIASSFVSATKKKEVIALLAGDKQQREAIGMSSDNKSFRRYMAKETFWWQMIEASKRKEFTKQHRRSELRTKRFLDMEAVENSLEPHSPSTDDTEEDASLADRFVQTQEQAIAMQGEVCAILCDIRKFARKKKGRAAKKVHLFCTRNLVAGLTIGKIPAAAAVALVWVNFPTSLGVKHFEDSKSVPSWNLFSPDLAVAAFEIASRYVADQGWFSFACIPEQLPVIHTFAESFGFELFRCLNVLAEVAYTRQDPFEEVVLLHMPLYHRTGCPTPTYQRVAAGRHSKLAFDKKANWIMDLNGGTITEINHVVCRGGAERSPSFFRFLLEMLTKPQDVILDVFAGTGNMGREANKLDRNCVCIEQDELLYETLLLPMESRKD